MLKKELIERLSTSSMLNDNIEKYHSVLSELEKYGYIRVHRYENGKPSTINVGQNFKKAKDKYLE